METTLKVFAWIEIVMGALALLESAETNDFYALVGGALFIACGWVALAYIGERKKCEAKNPLE